MSLEIDWDRLESESNYLHEVPIAINRVDWRGVPGTRLEIADLRDEWRRDDVEDLQRELYLLVSPFREDSSFTITFCAPEFPGYSGQLSQRILNDADFILTSKLDAKGKRTHSLKPAEGKTIELGVGSGDATRSSFTCGPVEANHYIYRLGGGDWKLRPRLLGLGQVRRLLREYGGVRIYRDSFRVKPYGYPGNDCLVLNLLLARSPEFWPSTNTLVGEVRISHEGNLQLVDQTNREGIIRNRAYEDLVGFVLEGFNSYVEWRYQQRGPKRQVATSLDAYSRKITGHVSRIQTLTRDLDETVRENIRDQATKIADLSRETQRELLTELQMLRNLASLGIGIAVFGHETESDIRILKNVSELLNQPEDLNDADSRLVAKQLERAADRLDSYSSLITEYLREPKRALRTVSINEIIESVLGRFHYLLDEHQISTEVDLSPSLPLLDVRPIDIEAVLINLLTNSIHFMGASSSIVRRLSVKTRRVDDEVELLYADSGPGIPEELGDRVLLPFVTTKPNGTGLGLAIVKDTVEGYRGRVESIADPLGGAAFRIRLPVEPKT